MESKSKFKIIAIIEFILIILITAFFISQYNDSVKRTDIFEKFSPDKKYSLTFSEVGITYPLGSTDVEITVGKLSNNEWHYSPYMSIVVYNEGSATSGDFDFEWYNDYVIIHVKSKQHSDITYRIYWNDVFK